MSKILQPLPLLLDISLVFGILLSEEQIYSQFLPSLHVICPTDLDLFPALSESVVADLF